MPYNPIPDGFAPDGHADQEGDIIFLLDMKSTKSMGSDHRSLKVSSKIMSHASPVFKAMFHPRFTGRAEFSSKDLLELSMPDDDCEAMVWMCFALHLQDLPEGRMPLVLLKKLAILCDKYDCVRAMQSWSRLWMQALNTWSIVSGKYWDLLWIAYAFQEHETFWEVTEDLIYGHEAEEPSSEENSFDDDGLSLLPMGLSGMTFTSQGQLFYQT